MLVTHIEAVFLKKASDTLVFTCIDGKPLEETIQRALDTGAGQEFRAASVGRLPDGTEATQVWITWSFKAKSTNGKGK